MHGVPFAVTGLSMVAWALTLAVMANDSDSFDWF